MWSLVKPNKKGKPQLDPVHARDAGEVVKLIKFGEPSIKCINARLTQEDARAFSELLRQPQPGAGCSELFLGANEIQSQGAMSFAEALGNPKVELRKLDLAANLIDYRGAVAIADKLRLSSNVLQVLNLSFNEIKDAGAKALGEALKHQAGAGSSHSSPLLELNLQMNDIGGKRDDHGTLLDSEGAEALADALKQPCDVKILNLGGNMLGSTGGKRIADALSMNTILEQLDLSGTLQEANINAEGAAAIAGALRMPNPFRQLTTGDLQEDHFSLQYLNLSYNNIDDATGRLLATELKKNMTIRQLFLEGNQLASESGRTFAEMLCINNVMKRIDLRANKLDPLAGCELAMMLKANKGLRFVHLGRNEIGTKYCKDSMVAGTGPAQEFANAVQGSRMLDTLDLGGCGFDDADAALIMDAALNQEKTAYNVNVNLD